MRNSRGWLHTSPTENFPDRAQPVRISMRALRGRSIRNAGCLAAGTALMFLLSLGVAGCEGGGGAKAVDAPPKRQGETTNDDRRGRGARDPRLDSRGQMQTPRQLVGEGPPWAIVLGTFTGDDHRAVAIESQRRLAERIPEFRAARVQHRTAGSVIVWGAWARIDDPVAQAELRRVQAFEYQGARPFASAMLTRSETTGIPVIGPHDLRQLRAKHPNHDSLQTLQVAAWADFDGTMSIEEIRRKAEAHAARLRSEGFEAWYHHDDHLKMSVVTVGTFDHTAFNSRASLYSDEVEALMRHFQFHLVNDDPLIVRIDPRNPRSRETAQPCQLVMVPR